MADSDGSINQEQEALAKIREMSIQRRAEEDQVSGFSTLWTFNRPWDESDIPPWWSEARELKLAEFAHVKGNDILQGAISSMTKKFKAMSWMLEGPKATNPDDPQPGTVDWHQRILASAEYGQGWGALLTKSLQDYLVHDKGMAWELIGPGNPEGPIQEPGVMGIAHLDISRCQLTGDPVYPIIFNDAKDGLPHKMHNTRVAHASDMTSPNQDMNGVGFSATSRVVATSQVILKVFKYKDEKLDDLPETGLLILNNILPQRWEDTKARYQRGRRNLNQEIWTNIMTLIGLDPQYPVSAQFISFANLPDHFNEVEQVNMYLNIVALAFGVDTREFWPISGQPLGTATETLVQHQKARGKGVGEIISTIERIVNWKVLPRSVAFGFDFQDDEEDKLRAEISEIKIKSIMSMWQPPKSADLLEAGLASPVTAEEIRQMLADNVPYFKESFLKEGDLTPDTVRTEDRRKEYGQKAWMNELGEWGWSNGNKAVNPSQYLSHIPISVHNKCPLCGADAAYKFEGHGRLLLCAGCGKTYDPVMEIWRGD